MKPINVILIIVGVLVLTGIVYLVYQSNKQAKIKAAAVAAGVSPNVAQTIAESSNPAGAARSIGIPDTQASAIAAGNVLGVAVLSPQAQGNLKYVGSGTFYQCPAGSIRQDTGTVNASGSKIYDCYIEEKATS